MYDGAVYLFHGRPYLCKRLDLTARVAHVVAADVRYYTKPVHNRDVHVTGSRLAYAAAAAPQFGRTTARVGPAVVTERFMAFVRIWRGSGIAFDRVDLFLPDVQFMTEAAYVRCAAAAAPECLIAASRMLHCQVLLCPGGHSDCARSCTLAGLCFHRTPQGRGSRTEAAYERPCVCEI